MSLHQLKKYIDYSHTIAGSISRVLQSLLFHPSGPVRQLLLGGFPGLSSTASML